MTDKGFSKLSFSAAELSQALFTQTILSHIKSRVRRDFKSHVQTIVDVVAIKIIFVCLTV